MDSSDKMAEKDWAHSPVSSMGTTTFVSSFAAATSSPSSTPHFSTTRSRRSELSSQLEAREIDWKAARITEHGGKFWGHTSDIRHRFLLETDCRGAGAFGAVFVAEDRLVSGRQVAVKRLPISAASSQASFERETRILKDLDHPNICRMHATYSTRSNLYIVLEHCAGGDLFTLLSKSGALDEPTASSIVRQLSGALHYAHSKSVVHRDLKPENVCFASATAGEYAVKLVDWGVSVDLRTSSAPKGPAGSIAYAAPEVYGKQRYGLACDLWSLGVLTYVCLIGSVPFSGGLRNQLRCMQAEEYPTNTQAWTNLSVECKDLIAKLLRAAPADRLGIEAVVQHPWLATNGPKLDRYLALKVLRNLNHSVSSSSDELALLKCFVAQELDFELSSSITKVFDALDTSKCGSLSLEDFQAAFANLLGASESDMADLEQLFHQLDLDQSGRLEYTEFAAASLGKEQLGAMTISSQAVQAGILQLQEASDGRFAWPKRLLRSFQRRQGRLLELPALPDVEDWLDEICGNEEANEDKCFDSESPVGSDRIAQPRRRDLILNQLCIRMPSSEQPFSLSASLRGHHKNNVEGMTATFL